MGASIGRSAGFPSVRVAAAIVVVAAMTASLWSVRLDSRASTGAPSPMPSSMAAVGDSFTFGWSPGAPGCVAGSCPAYSWATGTSVTSHYERILALNPSIAGHAYNVAQVASTMAAFAGPNGQAHAAAAHAPDYVTVMLGAGDICFGGASVSVSAFTASFRDGMNRLTSESPNSHVLVASVWNFESLRAAVLGRHTGSWFCPFFGADDATRALAMQRVVELNQALATECATYPTCRFDGNALFDHVWTADEVSAVDDLHPSASGQEMIADVLWRAGFWAGPRQPTSAADCRNGGWRSVTDGSRRAFRNQGDCVSFVATGGKNGAAG